MMHSLTGKVALVTGGSRGIGAAIAGKLARAGADVAITYVNSRTRAGEVVADIESAGRRGLAIQADSAISDHGDDRIRRKAILAEVYLPGFHTGRDGRIKIR